MPMTWTPRIDRALAVAARLHEGRYRKGDPTPYVYHPIAVALIVSDFTDSEDVVVAALLHDVLEDVPPETYSAEDMTAEFGVEVTALVQGVSEPKVAGAPKRPWQERKEGYLRRLAGEQAVDGDHAAGRGGAREVGDTGPGDRVEHVLDPATLRDLQDALDEVLDLFRSRLLSG